jgi:hypothetical protein
MELVAVLKAAFPRQPVEPETVKVYANFLVDLDVDAATAAAKRLVATSRFFPTIAELREAAAETELGLPNEVEAWDMVNRFVFHQGDRVPCPAGCDDGWADRDGDVVCPDCHGYGWVEERPPPLHPVLRQALDFIGGSWGLRATGHSAVLRAQFRDAYRTLRPQAVRGVAIESLVLDGGPKPPELEAAPQLRSVG